MSDKREREKRREERLQKEAESHGEERRKRLIQLGGGAAVLALLVVAVVIVVSQNQGSSGGGGGDTNLEDVGLVENQLQGIPQNGMVLGEPSARVTLIEFGDLQCPICKAYSEEVIPQIISGPVRDGEAKIEFRNFTIISEQSVPAGAAAIAAGEQGRAWNYIELFYRNQGEERSGYVTEAFMTSIAKGAKVPSLERWNADRKSKPTLAEVARTTKQASDVYEFDGTPSFVAKGPGGTESLGTPGSAAAIETAIQKVG
jgi:protein-disulfide isomerase